MGKTRQIGKHCAVIAINDRRNISQEPEMVRLIEVDREMTTDEKVRTERYLSDLNSRERKLKGVTE